MHRSEPRLSPPFVRALLALLVPLLIVACSGPGGPGTTPTPGGFAGNNSAVLSGAAYGGGSASANLARTVDVSVQGNAQGFVFGDASLMRRSVSSQGLYLTIPVRNDGAARCLVQFNDTALLNAGGNTLVNELEDYALGSLGRLANGDYTDTCLDAGESGYLFNIFLDSTLFANVDRVRIGSVEGDTGATNPQIAVEPQSYQIAAGGGSLAVTARNDGNGTVALGEFSLYIRLDANGDPYGWSFFDDPIASQLAPGASTVYSDVVAFDGSATGMQPYIDAVPATASVTSAPASERSATAPSPRERWRLRSARAAATHADFSAWLEQTR